MSKAILVPCPFCGGPASWVSGGDNCPGEISEHPACFPCDFRLSDSDEWNRRAEPAPAKPRRSASEHVSQPIRCLVTDAMVEAAERAWEDAYNPGLVTWNQTPAMRAALEAALSAAQGKL